MNWLRFFSLYVIGPVVLGGGGIYLASCYFETGQAITMSLMVVLIYITGVYAYFTRQSVAVARESIEKQEKRALYTYLADKWYEMAIKEMDEPDFTDSNKTSSYKTNFKGRKLKKYESFARCCWGHVEDIFFHDLHKDKSFEPSIKRCKELHYSWLQEPENKNRFNDDILKYIDSIET